MSAFSFRRTAMDTLEMPWRPLDRALARWVLAHGGDERLAALAASASHAESLGNTVLQLADDHGDMVQVIGQLRQSALVGDGGERTPFVVDDDGRFYLWRNFAHECFVAARLRERLDDDVTNADRAADPARLADIDRAVDEVFIADRSAAVQAQREAVAGVCGRRLFVLTGGPGTGKTTTVLRMLLMLQAFARSAEPLRILVAAPTGKAAQRLLQSLRAGKEKLRPQLPASWQRLLDAVPDREALTVHRLLAFSPQANAYRRHRDDPIAADVVVIDEASMVDLAMLRAVLDAVPAQACLILVGDADQLTSVAAGSVLQDLVQVLEQQHPAQVVRLQHSFRAARQLQAINAAVRAGDVSVLNDAIAAAGADARVHIYSDERTLARLAVRWADRLATVLGAVRSLNAVVAEPGEDASAARALQALQALSQQQLLSALREHGSGALTLNRLIEQRLRTLWQVPAQQQWYAGRAVMITRNDYAAGLFNGDIGLVLADHNGDLRVWFESLDDDGRPTARGVPPGLLPAHEGAFAISIHKSQGSEYARVAVVLPADPAHRILSRQLLYTALSRARASVEIWAPDASIRAALAQIALRHGVLAARLASATSA